MSLFNPPVMYTVHPEIMFTENEQRIKGLLKDFCDYYNDKYPASSDESCNNDNAHEPLLLRITGGWVRDKLLGKESHDIDIAINKLSGEKFAIQLNEYIVASDKYNKVLNASSIHKIDKNPEKSKHLETTTTKLFGESIDFVNLRNEEYTNINSRVPTIVEFGTAKQDALRRDATLNALFYNLTTDEIEDFTGSGFEDLQRGVLKTPLEPLKTFLDDPLRVLRLIRFASQFGFKIDNHTFEVMKGSSEVKLCLLKKVSRERVGIELGKLLVSAYPLVGLNAINEVGLYDVVLSIPEENVTDQYLEQFFQGNFPGKFKQDMELLNTIYDNLSASENLSALESELFNLLQWATKKSEQEKIFQRTFYLVLIFKNLTPLLPKPDYQLKINKKKHYPIEYIIKESFRFNKVEADLVNKILIQEAANTRTFNDPEVLIRKSVVGFNVIRYMKTQDYWKLSLILKYFQSYTDVSQRNHYAAVYDFVVQNGLSSAFNDKLIIDGKQMAKIIDKKPGPWLSSVNNLIFKWQLDYEGNGNQDEKKEACIKYIKEDEEVQKLIG